MSLTVGSLFAGIGGFDLAARWMGWRTIWVSEIDSYASAVLAKHFPEAPNLGDITKIDWHGVESPVVLCGGFPCQDISNAGKREGITGARSGLWKEYARAIRELRPRYVVIENVAALLGRGASVVLGDLAALGYDAEWEIISAADVGAPHLRERLWILAYAVQCDGRSEPGKQQGQRSALAHSGCAGDVADTDCRGRGEPDVFREQQRRAETISAGETIPDSAGIGSPRQRTGWRGGDVAARTDWKADSPFGGGWWCVEPNVGRVAHGVPARVDRLKGLGNAIVPQCAVEGPFCRIQELEAQR